MTSNYETVPDRWVDYLNSTPETGMGYWIATVTTNDGRIFERVVINGGFITQDCGYEHVPFHADEIKDIEITHDKSEFSKS